MIADVRIYTCKPNKMGEFVKIYEELAWPLQSKYLGRNLGWFTTIEGEWDEVMAVVRRAMLAAGQGAERVSLVLKADDRPGVMGAMESKVRAVEARLE